MRFSVVIPTFNRQAALRQTLKAIKAQCAVDFEVIVVDDGSTDGTECFVASEYPSVRSFRQANRGPAAARNLGISMAKGDFVAFTDDDCVPPVNWLERLSDGHARYPEAAGVGGYLEAPAETLKTNSIAKFEYYVSHYTYAAGKTEYYGGCECPAGGTNNISYRRDILELVGGFDESFPYAAGEDADLKWRICQLGYMLLYVPLAVTHIRPYTWDSFRRQQVAHGRGSVHFDRKYGGVPSPARLILRIAKRGLQLFSDTPRMGPRLAWVKLWGGWFECWGQWQEIRRLSGAS